MERALFIGRWQTPKLHDGHLWCFEQKLKQGIPVAIAIRPMQRDEKNPYSPDEVKANIESQLASLIESGEVAVFILPFDISAVVYGRGVGYEVEQLIPPPEIAEISATKIRQQLSEQQS